MTEEQKEVMIKKSWFVTSLKGNIKEKYYFEKKLGSGGYGTVYQARKKETGSTVLNGRRPSCDQSHLEAGGQGPRELPQ